MNKYLLFLIFFSAPLLAQETIGIDSLKQITFEEKLHDSIISNSYASLLRHYKRNNEDSCLVYFRRLKEYADKNESALANYHYYRLKAGYYGLFPELSHDKYKFLRSNLLSALSYAKKTGDPKLVVYNYSRLGQEIVRLGKNDEALGYVQEAIKIAIEEDLWFEMAYIYGQTGELYSLGFNQTEKALPFLLKSDSIYLANNFHGDRRGSTLSYIGDVYTTLGNIKEARAYQEKALTIFNTSKNEFKQKLIITKLANIEAEDKNYNKAINYLLESIAYYQDKKFPINEGICYTLLSEVYFKNNQIEKAITAGQTSIDLNKRNNYDYGLFLALLGQSKILHENGDYIKSNELALEAEVLGLELENYSNLEPVYEKLYLNYEKLGDFENAYKYAKIHKRASDTLVAMQNIEKAKELEAQYKNSQQKQEIQLLQSQNELVEEQKRNQRNLLFAIIGLIFLAGLVLYFLYRNKQKINDKLKEVDTIKSNFFTNISHEFRTPLTLISGPIEKQLENSKLANEDRKDLEMVQRNSKRLLDLVDQLLDLSKLESGNLKLRIKEGSVSMLLKSLAGAFQYKAEKRDINYHVDIEEIKDSWFDADAIEKIVVNLLTNAFKYTPKYGNIKFSSSVKNEMLEIVIENDGEIMTTKNIEAVFNRFYQADDSADGVGVGLALVKELVTLYEGTIHVENTTNESVLFNIRLPIKKHQFSDQDIVYETNKTDSLTEATPSQLTYENEEQIFQIDADAPILLVVEDNEDIRTFIKTAFEREYQVMEAENGAEGIELALASIPDMIISDIMMPEVNGLELCERLKNDERTSHIPIILLTAKVEEHAQYEGLDLGADDYVLKPFKTKFLETRVKNLVLSRKLLRDRYSQEVVLKPKDISISRIDEKFVQKVQAILDVHLTDSEFSIEEFSKLLNMSRMQMHRKIKALTGLTASEFVRSQRLLLATSLLKGSDVNVSEVCYQVGFNNHSYFTKCFKDAFGCLPSEYVQN
ncbi:response regulator [Rasiella rasia]|uniref:histidine kinase n=1 Tax=Rasiella rasia TaxID=2744027 RepID=A0A6G6GK38_9FLAO|nr:response regulator [Rasiella rasia]QIE58884.1 response regulator [Rasiella rasia]